MKTLLTASSTALLLASTATTAQISAPANGPQIVLSHRGASAYAPEHTFFAYDLAMAQDTDVLECDVFLTKDEVPVCIHDETVDRTTGNTSTGRVDSFTLAELRRMDFGSWFNTANPTLAKPEFVGAHIVPFEEELDCYLRHNPKMRFYPETKDSAAGRAEAVLQELLTRKGLIATGDPAKRVPTSTVMLQSFDAKSLERMRTLNSTIPTGFLYTAPSSADIAMWQATGTGPAYIDFFIPNSANLLADPTVVQRFHAAGHDVHTWTVNDANQMDLLLSYGVDGLFTNNSDVLRARITAKGSGTSKADRNNPETFARGCPGIAGRVTSKDGPGDVWEPTGLRGVQLKSTSGSGSSSGSSSSGGSSSGAATSSSSSSGSSSSGAATSSSSSSGSNSSGAATSSSSSSGSSSSGAATGSSSSGASPVTPSPAGDSTSSSSSASGTGRYGGGSFGLWLLAGLFSATALRRK